MVQNRALLMSIKNSAILSNFNYLETYIMEEKLEFSDRTNLHLNCPGIDHKSFSHSFGYFHVSVLSVRLKKNKVKCKTAI